MSNFRIVIDLPPNATEDDARAVGSLLQKAIPQAGLLVTFMGSGLGSAQAAKIKEILPKATVKAVRAPPATV